MDIMRETDPQVHKAVFTRAANDVILRSIPKLNTQIKRKWNLVMTPRGKYDWVVASALDRSASSAGGKINFRAASVERPLITITMDGSPINDMRFNYSFAAEVKAAMGLKKQAKIIKKMNKTSEKDLKRPRVKILKGGSTTTLHNAFYATMPTGHTGIYRRKSGEKKKMMELRTITLPSMFKQLKYNSMLEAHFQENMTKRYDHYLLLAMKQKMRG